jgi:hypothetical protein
VENPSTEELGDAQEVALLAPHRGVHAGTPDRIARAVPEQVSEIGRDRRHDSARIEYEAFARRPARPGDDALTMIRSPSVTNGVSRFIVGMAGTDFGPRQWFGDLGREGLGSAHPTMFHRPLIHVEFSAPPRPV